MNGYRGYRPHNCSAKPEARSQRDFCRMMMTLCREIAWEARASCAEGVTKGRGDEALAVLTTYRVVKTAFARWSQ